jgi:RNA polymerase sigma-70 factor (ECF subfamily)
MNPNITDIGKCEDYVECLTQCQSNLYAYIYSLTGNSSTAQDILQETNHMLWRLRSDYDPERTFLPWAIAVAYNQVRAARKKMARERLVFQHDETLQALADEQGSGEENEPNRLAALEHCLGKLDADQRLILEGHYRDGKSLDEIGEVLQLRVNTIAVRLHRIRKMLADCIRGAT